MVRLASIAPVTVEISFNNSVGVWKRCAGSFSSRPPGEQRPAAVRPPVFQSPMVNANARNGGLRTRFIGCLRQPKVNDFGCHSTALLDTDHDVAWFDVPVNELLLVHRTQTGGDLRRDFQRQVHLKGARALDETLERLALDKLHRVKVVLTASS
jgi:hypothetical protein